MTHIGGKGVMVGGIKVWSNSKSIERRLRDEVKRKEFLQSQSMKEGKGRKWKEIVEEGILEEIGGRESLGGLNLVEKNESKYNPGMLVVSKDDAIQEIYYVDSTGEFYDEITGRRLLKAEVIKARLEEMQQFAKHKVYVKVPIQQCYDSTGKSPIKVRWIDINKGDEENREYRSRLVAKEIKTDKRLDLFAATPPLEAKKSLFSFAVTEGIGFQSGDRKGGKKIDFVDIKRAYFQADSIREVYVDLPEEDQSPGMCGLLGKSMYGTRDAAQNWGETYMSFMTAIGFDKGIGSPCAFYHKKKDLICVVHGDDFTILGWSNQLDWFWKEVQIKFEAKHRGRIGPDDGDEKEMRILNRIVTWTSEGIGYEGDQRHVEICIDNLGLMAES